MARTGHHGCAASGRGDLLYHQFPIAPIGKLESMFDALFLRDDREIVCRTVKLDNRLRRGLQRDKKQTAYHQDRLFHPPPALVARRYHPLGQGIPGKNLPPQFSDMVYCTSAVFFRITFI
jgi:hypothetical protein